MLVSALYRILSVPSLQPMQLTRQAMENEGRDRQRQEEENKEVIAWGGANLISSTSIVS